MSLFKNMDLSRETKSGLKNSGYSKPTEIQSQTLEPALKGEDVLAAGKTGSGKTLAFIIPVLERLHKIKWNPMDGLGALIITPTRELAYQIFEVLRAVGRYHSFSAGLVIGGKDLKLERDRLSSCNIIVCTPGRILQHMDENATFYWDQLQIVVLDEADKILSLGFAKTMNAIIQNLPASRQTLLFSATQTKSVKDLARLSLKNPKCVSADELSATCTPDQLKQSFLVCELHEKIDLLWSFLKSHQKQKIMVFMASCKQVKYLFELFCRMKPGSPLLALYGTLHQLRRMKIYDEFCRKQNAVLFSTDVAARGLDFPAVEWVVQLDCPEDVNTYIHRVGRTARIGKEGHSLLALLPSEKESMLKKLQEKQIPITEFWHQDVMNYRFSSFTRRKAEALCARDVSLKESAQRAFKSYFKSVFLMRDKEVFNVRCLDRETFAHSLGLEVTPRVRFLEKASLNKSGKPVQTTSSRLEGVADKHSKPHSSSSSHKQISLFEMESDEENDDDEKDDLFTVKSTWRFDDAAESQDSELNIPVPEPPVHESDRKGKKPSNVTKAAVAKKLARKKIKPNTKIVFDDEGRPVVDLETKQTSEKLNELEQRKESGIDIELAKEIMKDEDKVDKMLHKKVIKEKKFKKKLKEKEAKRKEKRAILLAGHEDTDADELDERTQKFIDELPDPDQVMLEDSDEENERGSSKRRKLASSSSSSEGEEDNEWELPDPESLALHLLSK